MRSGLAGAYEVWTNLEDPDEGGELERHAFQLLEFLCPFGTYRGPQVVTNGKLRQFTDIALRRRCAKLDASTIALWWRGSNVVPRRGETLKPMHPR